MKYFSLFLLALVIMIQPAFSQSRSKNNTQEYQLNTRIDNLGYWKEAASLGLTTPNPVVPVAPAQYQGSQIDATTVITEDSPDVPVITGSTSQSENSIFVEPNANQTVLNSNNSTGQPGGGITLYGANDLYSFDGGDTWEGELGGAGGSNQGDPAAVILNDGRWVIGYIKNNGQYVSYSDDQGTSWTSKKVADAPGGFSNLLDKNHLWVDNSPTSSYDGNLYDAWTCFGGADDNDIVISRSTDGGDTWSAGINVSNVINAGSHSQGVNIKTGPNGEVYAVFAIYDSWPSDETAIGLARSFDGGQTYESFRAIENIRGIRTSGVGKSMRVNSFPSAAVDISTGPNRGNIYIAWANIGVPGSNTGSDCDAYIIRSEDDGDTWSDPIRINQDESNLGKKHYFPWITCDPVSGTLSAVFYDDRNVGSSQCEVFCANSYDAGETWEDFKVSDVSFTPSPIPGLASDYFGDYLGISAHGGYVYPVWTDNRTGTALTYVSPYQTSTMTPPTNLVASLENETGVVHLNWIHPLGPTFEHFNVYRDDVLLGTTVWPAFNDTLPDYGLYTYQVTAFYTVEGESDPVTTNVQWGTAIINVNPDSLSESLVQNTTSTQQLTITNTGQLPLDFESGFTLPDTSLPGSRAYCSASGGCGEYINRVTIGAINNTSGCNGYEDFTSLSTVVVPGGAYPITIRNGASSYPSDICAVWIDWDQSQSFSSSEKVTLDGTPGIGPYTGTVIVPDNALNGATRMRVRIIRNGTISACGVTQYGEVEDYTINVLAWVTATPMFGQVDPGNSETISVIFNSTGLEVGEYMANYTITNNDPGNPEIIIPVTLNVQNVYLTITADKDSVCLGSSTQLHAMITGGSGTFTYSWTSDPPGFTSTEAEPTVSPEQTTIYFVEATDGSITLNDQITIGIFPLPEVDLGADIGICEGSSEVLDAGPGHESYFWNTGDNSQAITVNETGVYWVDVTNVYGCVSRDSVNVTVSPNPVVDLGSEGSFCEGTTHVLDAGTGFASYLWSTGETSSYITVDEAGTYWVSVTDAMGCSGNDTVELSIDPMPGVANITSGPVTVDNYTQTSTIFVADPVQDASTYLWEISPTEAGEIIGNETQGEVTWTTGFTGTVEIVVTGINDCGAGEPSLPYQVEVYSSQGLDDPSLLRGAKVYPNPNEGTFVLELNALREAEITIRLSNASGKLVSETKEYMARGEFRKTFILDNQAKGIYYLSVEKGASGSGNVIFTDKIVVR